MIQLRFDGRTSSSGNVRCMQKMGSEDGKIMTKELHHSFKLQLYVDFIIPLVFRLPAQTTSNLCLRVYKIFLSAGKIRIWKFLVRKFNIHDVDALMSRNCYPLIPAAAAVRTSLVIFTRVSNLDLMSDQFWNPLHDR